MSSACLSGSATRLLGCSERLSLKPSPLWLTTNLLSPKCFLIGRAGRQSSNSIYVNVSDVASGCNVWVEKLEDPEAPRQHTLYQHPWIIAGLQTLHECSIRNNKSIHYMKKKNIIAPKMLQNVYIYVSKYSQNTIYLKSELSQTHFSIICNQIKFFFFSIKLNPLASILHAAWLKVGILVNLKKA